MYSFTTVIHCHLTLFCFNEFQKFKSIYTQLYLYQKSMIFNNIVLKQYKGNIKYIDNNNWTKVPTPSFYLFYTQSNCVHLKNMFFKEMFCIVLYDKKRHLRSTFSEELKIIIPLTQKTKKKIKTFKEKHTLQFNKTAYYISILKFSRSF